MNSPALRRTPVQERSKRRVQAILDAAAHVFADEGFESATMDRIAERAVTSIGSVYQFFPNKLAVFEALAERCNDGARQLFDVLLAAGEPLRPWREVLDDTIDVLANLQEADPAFRAIMQNFQLFGHIAEQDAELNRELAARLEQLFTRYSPKTPKARRRVVAIVVVDIVSAMLFMARREEPSVARKIIAETKLLVRRYVEPEIVGG